MLAHAHNHNVVEFKQPKKEGNKQVYKYIRIFLDNIKSENTRKTYERSIRDFFIDRVGKDIEHITEEDLICDSFDVMEYQMKLRNEFKGSTVNNRISALKKCYRMLQKKFDVSVEWFDVERDDEYDSKKYDALTTEEVIQSIELVKHTRKGFEKSLLIELAFSTAFRKQSLLDLTWNDLSMHDNAWIIKTLGKGNKWDYKKISNQLHDRLMELKELHNVSYPDSNKIFHITSKTVDKMIDYIRNNIDFGDRYIVFHSFKKSSIEEVRLITNNDIKAMQRQGNHSSASTTLNNYLSDKKLEDTVIVDINFRIPVEKFEEMTKEELVDMLLNSDRNTQIKLLQQIGEI